MIWMVILSYCLTFLIGSLAWKLLFGFKYIEVVVYKPAPKAPTPAKVGRPKTAPTKVEAFTIENQTAGRALEWSVGYEELRDQNLGR